MINLNSRPDEKRKYPKSYMGELKGDCYLQSLDYGPKCNESWYTINFGPWQKERQGNLQPAKAHLKKFE